MSRIDEALRRARELGTPAGKPVATAPPAEFGRATDLDLYPGEVDRRKARDNARPAPEPARSVPDRGAPRREKAPNLAARVKHLGAKMVISPEASPHLIEQLRGCASRLCQVQGERSAMIVMVTSALSGEGKTLTAANLALTLSESFKQSVLIIDADFRRPTMHNLFEVANVAGLADSLASSEPSMPQPVQLSANLALLPAGQASVDPISILSSPAMKRLLQRANAAYTWVFVDTPPIAHLSDARLLAGSVDSTVLVVRAESTPYDAVQTAIDEIGRDRIAGVVLNQVRVSEVNPDYSAYGYAADEPS